ncbi:MAG: DUF4440 domain-containing protein [Candidatus Latescibacteria bacterium]|jgi:hypothetical protein|nr:DUF4440 domain-containing protein [Candidatus Latescibacterota bacterium]
MNSPCGAEIVELHQFFEDWFNGNIPDTAQEFQRMDVVMDASFVIVMPDGKRVDRDPLLELLKKSHGKRAGIRIWIENVRVLVSEGGIVIAEYEEWQEENSETTSRVSTVVFREKEETPNGLSWVRVHETWFDRQ